MKLCPQCAFIYEDEQRVCDMDGSDLVSAAPTILEPNRTAPTRLTIDLTPTSQSSAAISPSRRSFVRVILLVVLGAILSAVIVTQFYRSRSSHAIARPPASSALPDNEHQPSPADLVSSASTAANTLIEPSPDPPLEFSRTNVNVAASATRARLASSPVLAGAANGRPRAITLHLTNGATIDADDVWERKEGMWYRQGGMVTFLKRSRVMTIERIATPRSQQKTTGNSVAERNGKPAARTPENQLRLRRLESVETKKPSRVKGFLKWTGRVLKKPFKS